MMFKIHCPWVYGVSLTSNEIVLSLEDSKHLRNVLRCKDGEEVIAFDGCGNFRSGRLILGKVCKVVFEGSIEHESISTGSFTLIQCLTNNVATFEVILRKACELGIREIVPILSDRSESQHWSCDAWNKRQDRFQRILIESCKQAKNPYLPKVMLPIKFNEVPEKTFRRSVYGALRMSTKPWLPWTSIEDIACIIGPEGGFSASEEEFLNQVSFGIHLPTYVMRVETAVVALMSVLKLRVL